MKPIKYELILLFSRNWIPKEIIKLGYNKQTVYRYHKRYKLAEEKIKEIVKHGKI